MEENWEKIDETSRRLRVPGGYLYNTWSMGWKVKDCGFLTGTYKWKEPINEQTIFVPDVAKDA
jgi:hypothetical protein